MTSGRVLPRQASPEVIRERFVGRGQEWFGEVAGCLRDTPDELPSLLLRPGEESWRALSAEGRVRWQDQDPLAPATGVHPWCSAANAIVGLAQALADPSGAFDRVEPALAHWERAGCTSVTGAGTLVSYHDDLPAGVRELLLRLQAADPGPSGGFTALLALELAGVPARHGRSVQVPVLVDRGGVGADLVLRFRLRSGPPGLHPDPACMAFGVTDTAFTGALGTVWKLSELSGTGLCVTWAVLQEEQPCNDIHGNSIGAAAAIALHELHERRWLSRPRLRRLDRRCAITGDLRHDGAIEPVEGYKRKLEAARSAGLRVLLPAGSRDEYRHLPGELGVPARWAADVDDAVRLSRQGLMRPLAVIAAALAVVTLVTAVLLQPGDAASRRAEEAARRRAVAADLAAQATTLGRTDPRLAGLLALAGYRIAPTSTRAVDAMRDIFADNRNLVRSWQAAPSRVTALAVDDPHDRVYTAGDDGRITSWDLRNGTRIGQVEGTADQLTLNTETTVLAAVTGTGITFYDVAARRPGGPAGSAPCRGPRAPGPVAASSRPTSPSRARVW